MATAYAIHKPVVVNPGTAAALVSACPSSPQPPASTVAHSLHSLQLYQQKYLERGTLFNKSLTSVVRAECTAVLHGHLPSQHTFCKVWLPTTDRKLELPGLHNNLWSPEACVAFRPHDRKVPARSSFITPVVICLFLSVSLTPSLFLSCSIGSLSLFQAMLALRTSESARALL